MEAQLREQKTEAAEVKKPNLTGIPTQMKLDFEQRSGLSFDDVRVHYNSDKPARLGALAYTQGTQIHVGPGQERHLPHELGHVVQQKAGRVRPTRWIGGLPVNDQPELEREADLAPVQCMPAPDQQGVIQMYTDEEMFALQLRFLARGWDDVVDDHVCRALLEKVDANRTPRIGNHLAVLQRISTGVLRIKKQYFSGSGPMGRTTKENGAVCIVNELPDDPGYVDVAYAVKRSVTLKAPPSHSSRDSLNQVMGGSAAKLSGIVNAEFLHIIGHQLGGSDTPENLMAGLHALNTAMIPLENLVADLASCGLRVDYTVRMWPRPGPVIWVSSATITISVTSGESHYCQMLSLNITDNPTNLLDDTSYHKIEAYAEDFYNKICG